ncbi:Bug family tripartite tricarboxylate transporter substrate binding protein [Verticiella sediminum]|nr:tripartite tricarboxylate transporter substrate binding protein [Verticiella sediminum]
METNLMIRWKQQLLLGLAGSLLAAGLTTTARAETWPSQPLRIIVPFPAGGAGDLVPRIIGESLSRSLGQPVIVENRPGAEGAIGVNAVARAKPDGYTLGVATSGPVVIGKRLFTNLPYDPKTDLAPIGLTYETPFVLAVPAASPAQSLADLFRLAKEKPGTLNIAIPNSGSVQHLLSEQMQDVAGLEILSIPYKGGGPAAVAVAAGEVDMTWAALPNVTSLIDAGKLRAIAVSSTERHPLLPNVPTVLEQGWPGLVASNWNGLIAPAGTPDAILDRLNREVNVILEQPEVVGKFKEMGVTPRPETRSGFQDLLNAEEAKWAEVIEAADIKPL